MKNAQAREIKLVTEDMIRAASEVLINATDPHEGLAECRIHSVLPEVLDAALQVYLANQEENRRLRG